MAVAVVAVVVAPAEEAQAIVAQTLPPTIAVIQRQEEPAVHQVCQTAAIIILLTTYRQHLIHLTQGATHTAQSHRHQILITRQQHTLSILQQKHLRPHLLQQRLENLTPV